MARQPVLYVRSPKQWETILAPIRTEILQGLRCLGPCSAGELAEMLDRPADTLYRHIELLLQAGFVVETGERKKGRHVERLFDLTADDFAMDFVDTQSPEGRAGLNRTAKAFLGTMARAFDDSASSGTLNLPRPDPNFVLNYEVSWLTTEDFKKARALMYQLKVLMDEARVRREGKLYASITGLCPITRKRRPSESERPGKKNQAD
jgi:predicted transcriptional regulator